MSASEYPCPTCGQPSPKIKDLTTRVEEAGGKSTIEPGVLVKCPVHGEMAVRAKSLL